MLKLRTQERITLSSSDTAMYRGGPEPGLAPAPETEVQSEALLTGSYPSHLNRPCLLHNGNYSVS